MASDGQAVRRVFFVVVPLFAVLLTLLAAEALLALLWPVPFASESNMYYAADPHLGYRLAPESVGWFPAAGEEGRTNRHGLRDDDFPSEKPPGELRILVVGDSFTMGADVGQDETYAQVLEELLRRDLDGPVQVVNAGVGGWGPFHYARYFEHYGHALDPDLVLVGFFVGNDAYNHVDAVAESRTAVDGRRVQRRSLRERHWTTRAKLWLYARSHLARRFWNRNLFVVEAGDLGGEGEPRDGARFPTSYLRIQARKASLVWARSRPDPRARARNAMEQIGMLKRAADAYGVPVHVVLIPDENQVNHKLAERVAGGAAGLANYDFTQPQPVLREMLAERGIESLDLLPDFLADPRRLFMNDSHFSPAGHRLAAERIRDYLLPHIRRLAAAR